MKQNCLRRTSTFLACWTNRFVTCHFIFSLLSFLFLFILVGERGLLHVIHLFLFVFLFLLLWINWFAVSLPLKSQERIWESESVPKLLAARKTFLLPNQSGRIISSRALVSWWDIIFGSVLAHRDILIPQSPLDAKQISCPLLPWRDTSKTSTLMFYWNFSFVSFCFCDFIPSPSFLLVPRDTEHLFWCQPSRGD